MEIPLDFKCSCRARDNLTLLQKPKQEHGVLQTKHHTKKKKGRSIYWYKDLIVLEAYSKKSLNYNR